MLKTKKRKKKKKKKRGRKRNEREKKRAARKSKSNTTEYFDKRIGLRNNGNDRMGLLGKTQNMCCYMHASTFCYYIHRFFSKEKKTLMTIITTKLVSRKEKE